MAALVLHCHHSAAATKDTATEIRIGDRKALYEDMLEVMYAAYEVPSEQQLEIKHYEFLMNGKYAELRSLFERHCKLLEDEEPDYTIDQLYRSMPPKEGAEFRFMSKKLMESESGTVWNQDDCRRMSTFLRLARFYDTSAPEPCFKWPAAVRELAARLQTATSVSYELVD